jgi:hypothetical protein
MKKKDLFFIPSLEGGGEISERQSAARRIVSLRERARNFSIDEVYKHYERVMYQSAEESAYASLTPNVLMRHKDAPRVWCFSPEDPHIQFMSVPRALILTSSLF